jgi:hypothetical protein
MERQYLCVCGLEGTEKANEGLACGEEEDRIAFRKGGEEGRQTKKQRACVAGVSGRGGRRGGWRGNIYACAG